MLLRRFILLFNFIVLLFPHTIIPITYTNYEKQFLQYILIRLINETKKHNKEEDSEQEADEVMLAHHNVEGAWIGIFIKCMFLGLVAAFFQYDRLRQVWNHSYYISRIPTMPVIFGRSFNQDITIHGCQGSIKGSITDMSSGVQFIELPVIVQSDPSSCGYHSLINAFLIKQALDDHNIAPLSNQLMSTEKSRSFTLSNNVCGIWSNAIMLQRKYEQGWKQLLQLLKNSETIRDVKKENSKIIDKKILAIQYEELKLLEDVIKNHPDDNIKNKNMTVDCVRDALHGVVSTVFTNLAQYVVSAIVFNHDKNTSLMEWLKVKDPTLLKNENKSNDLREVTIDDLKSEQLLPRGLYNDFLREKLSNDPEGLMNVKALNDTIEDFKKNFDKKVKSFNGWLDFQDIKTIIQLFGKNFNVNQDTCLIIEDLNIADSFIVHETQNTAGKDKYVDPVAAYIENNIRPKKVNPSIFIVGNMCHDQKDASKGTMGHWISMVRYQDVDHENKPKTYYIGTDSIAGSFSLLPNSNLRKIIELCEKKD